MTGITLMVVGGTYGPGIIPSGQVAYTSAGTYSWVAPAGVTSVSVVAVGGGGAGGSGTYNNGQARGGSGAGLGWKNNISVTPGQSYTVVVGKGGNAAIDPDGTPSYFINETTVLGGRGRGYNSRLGGTYVGDGGGNGGLGSGPGSLGPWYNGGPCAGGGAGGYSGNGGDGGSLDQYGAIARPISTGIAGSGGGGGGGSMRENPSTFVPESGGGGGVGIWGQGTNGAAGGTSLSTFHGKPGSTDLASADATNFPTKFGGGGSYFGSNTENGTLGVGGGGAVRIIWGAGRAFPATNTADI